MYIDKNLNWTTHINQFCIKLVKANSMFLKKWYFINEILLPAIFHYHLPYICTAW